MTFSGFVNVYCSDTAILQEITPQNIKNHAFCRHRRRAYSTEHTTLHISRLLHVEGRMGFHPSSHAPGPSQTQRGVWKTFKMKGAPHPVQMRCTLYRPASPPPAIMAVPAMTVICRTAMPVSWHPNAAPHRYRPASRNPGITRTRAGWHRDDRRGHEHRSRRNNCHRRCHNYRRRGHDHGRDHRQTDRNSKMNTGLSRQTGRADKCGRQKQFRFHNLQFLWFGSLEVAATARPHSPILPLAGNLAEELKNCKLLKINA